jgi:hypothetical protein
LIGLKVVCKVNNAGPRAVQTVLGGGMLARTQNPPRSFAGERMFNRNEWRGS